MRSKFTLVILTISIFLGSCDKLRELATIRINTKFTAEIPVNMGAASVKSPNSENIDIPLNFSEVHEIKLEDNFDIEPYLKKIKEIDISSVEIIAMGLEEGQIIHSVTLEVAGIGHILTLTNISADNNTFKPAIPQTLLDTVANKFITDKKITISVYGSANSPMSISVGVSLEAGVIAYVLK
jgi:hypothetical protein